MPSEQGEGAATSDERRFGRRAGKNFLSPLELEETGPLNVTVVGVRIIPPNERLGIEERDGLVVKMPTGVHRTLPLNVTNSKYLLEKVPEAESDDGKSVIGRVLTLEYSPETEESKAGILITKVKKA